MDAPIELAPPDPAWPARFAQERDRLLPVLARWLAGDLEHIGSTAVPGLAAKPVIDIMAPVHDLVSSRPAIAALQAIGYLHHVYGESQMHWFCTPSPQHRTHHLHLVPVGSALWRERLAFRDALRGDAALASAYAALKRELAVRHRDDRNAYAESKRPFIQQVLAGSLGTQPHLTTEAW